MMDLTIILQRFALFSGLEAEAVQQALPYCRDAAAELSRRASADCAAEPLSSAVAALAYYRWCLARMSGSTVPRLGAATLVTEETLKAAQRLCEQYMTAAAPYLGGGNFYFGQVTV